MKDLYVRRTVAFLIDMLIVSIIISVFGNLFSFMAFKVYGFEFLGMQFRISITAVFVFYLLYLIVFDIVKEGQTIGKLILNIIAVTENRKPPALKKRIVRSLYKTLSIIILPVAALLFFFGNHYTLQDRYTGTITVRE